MRAVVKIIQSIRFTWEDMAWVSILAGLVLLWSYLLTNPSWH